MVRHILASIARTVTLAILDDGVDRAGSAKHYPGSTRPPGWRPHILTRCPQPIVIRRQSGQGCDRPAEVTGQAREQVLDELAGDLPRQLHLQEQ